MNAFETADDRTISDFELHLGLGLDWPGYRYVSFEGYIGAGIICGLQESFKYRYHNEIQRTKAIGSVHLKAVVDIHTSGRFISLTGAFRAQMAFVSGRTGLYTVEAAPGITIRPFDQRNQILRTVAFRTNVWFCIIDDFDKVFDIQRSLVNPGIEVLVGF